MPHYTDDPLPHSPLGSTNCITQVITNALLCVDYPCTQIFSHWHAKGLKNLFSVNYSDKGSVYRPAEEQTYINYVDFLDEREGIGVLYYVGYHF